MIIILRVHPFLLFRVGMVWCGVFVCWWGLFVLFDWLACFVFYFCFVLCGCFVVWFFFNSFSLKNSSYSSLLFSLVLLCISLFPANLSHDMVLLQYDR